MNRNFPKVFISYAWTSERHRVWVRELAEKLSVNGIRVIYDQSELFAGQDKYLFMERMVNDPSIDKVLMICDSNYKEKADKRVGGVGTEAQIITPEVYNNAEQRKFIPILTERDDAGREFLPVFCKGRLYIDMSAKDSLSNDSFRKLINAITEQDENVDISWSDKIEIVELKLFSGSKERCPDLDMRRYQNAFKARELSCVYFEAVFKRPVKSEAYSSISYHIRDYNNNTIAKEEVSIRLAPGDNRVWCGFGYDSAGQWAVGEYSIIVGLKSSNYIERYFSIHS